MTDIHKKRMGSMMVSGEGEAAEPWDDLDVARVEMFLRLITLRLTASEEERDLMRGACDSFARSMEIDSACRCAAEPRSFAPLDEWRMGLEVCIGELAYDDKDALTEDDECGLAEFVEERLSVLTCGGLFGPLGRLSINGSRTEPAQ